MSQEIKISFVILSQGEPQTFNLLDFLFNNIDKNDEVLILLDSNNKELFNKF